MQYTGKGLFIRVVPDDAQISNVVIKENVSPITVVGTGNEFTFTEFTGVKPSRLDTSYWSSGVVNSGTFDENQYQADLAYYQNEYQNAKYVTVDQSVFDDFVEGDWIYPNQAPEAPEDSRQIVSKDYENFKYILDEPYKGATTGWGTITAGACKHVPFSSSVSTLPWDTNWSSEWDTEQNTIFHFYATGAGKYYDGLKIKGARNVELEKMYTDENGNPKYKYMFMDMAVYYEEEEGDKLLEGPWTVSLARKTPDGALIRDLATGTNLFIEDVIRDRSDYIVCIAGADSQKLSLPNSDINNPISERNRFHIMLLMSNDTPVGTGAYVPLGNALNFGGGYDGTTDGTPLYDPNTGNLYQSEQIWGRVKQGYMGSLTSVDGSIEQLREVTYPWYLPD